jgi:phytoene synthase
MHFAEAEKIMRNCPRRAVRAPRVMGEVYRSILDLLEARGFDAPRPPVHVSRARVVWAVLRFALV